MIVIDNNAIHIVDSVMGTGKTQACIAWMRQHPEQKYLYVTPYLDECSRIQASAPELDFQQPQENKTKSADLLRLLSEGKNITTTHELLSLMKDSDVEYVSFDFCHVENGSFADGYKRVTQEEKASFKELIEIYEGSYNDNWYGKTRKKDDRFLLSQNWFSKQSNSVRINQLRNNAYNFVRYKCKAHKEDVLWTSYKDYADALTSDKLTYQSRKSNWLAWNTKATNQYADRTVLVYLLNVFPNPLFKNYLENDNFQFNEDDYALSALLQWIWRSAIRNGKKVTIYIPAPRMRQLLTDWLNG